MQLTSLIAKKMEIKLPEQFENLIWKGKWSHWHQYFLFDLASSLHWPSANFYIFFLSFYISTRVQLIFDYAICHTEAVSFHHGNLMRHSQSFGNLRSEWHMWQQHSSGSNSSSSPREVAAPPALSIISKVALDPHSWSHGHYRAGKQISKTVVWTVAFVYNGQTSELLRVWL